MNKTILVTAKGFLVLFMPPVFFLATLAILAFTIVALFSGISFKELGNVFLILSAVDLLSLLLIHATGLSVKKILVAWFNSNFEWLMPV